MTQSSRPWVALNPGPQLTCFVVWAEGMGRGGGTQCPPPEGPHLTQVMTSPADRGASAVAETSECHEPFRTVPHTSNRGCLGQVDSGILHDESYRRVSAWGVQVCNRADVPHTTLLTVLRFKFLSSLKVGTVTHYSTAVSCSIIYSDMKQGS